MKYITRTNSMALAFSLIGIILFLSSAKIQDNKNSIPKNSIPEQSAKQQPKIQVAILLDVSSSMDGLIEQAKAQLWNMVSVMGKATCNNVSPQIEIALYEYGRTNNSMKDGYVKQLMNFTTDLDSLSQTLFNLKTDGGDEYCGQVIYSSLSNLNWDTATSSYKVIFIAGNEDFLQGSVSYTRACAAANKKGVIVNTIYCGDRMQGIREHWNLAGECGNGSFTNINQDAAMEDITTPYDSVLFSLNDQLNNTYIAYGYAGNSKLAKQQEVDKMNYSMNKSAAAKRVAVKGKKDLYNNAGWDLVDAYEKDSLVTAKIDMKTLPENLQKKSRAEITGYVKEKNSQRGNIQKEISATNIKREIYIAAEKKKSVTNAGKNATLETEIEKIIKKQATRFNMKIESN